MPKEVAYLPVIRNSDMLESFLNHLQNLNSKISQQLYIGAVFAVHLGLSLEELLSISVEDASGRSYLYKKKGRILLFSDEFYAYISNYIKSLPSDCELLFAMNQSRPYRKMSTSYFSMGIHRAFSKFPYNGKLYEGNYSTLIRTFTYHFVLNYGSYDSHTIRGEKLYTARLSSLSTLSREEYAELVRTYNDNDFASVLIPHSERMLEEVNYYLSNFPDCEPLKEKIAGFYKALFDLSDCMGITLRDK